jgi:hypothetical protein
MVCVIGSWLFYLKYTVLSIEERIREAQREIVIEKRNQHILKAEWKALTSPERIQHLSAKHLKDMHQVEPSQLREFDPLIFHSDKSRKTKRLSKLVDEILTSKGID